MKKIQLIYLILIFFVTIQTINAQQPNRQLRGTRGYVPPPRSQGATKTQPTNVAEEVNIMLPICVSEFGLDDFEKEIFKNMLTKKFENENSVLQSTKLSRDDKRKEYIAIDKNFYLELSSIMTAEEIEGFKFFDFKESKKEQKREQKKKKKKRKKNKSKQ